MQLANVTGRSDYGGDLWENNTSTGDLWVLCSYLCNALNLIIHFKHDE